MSQYKLIDARVEYYATEYGIHAALCDYLRLQYPDALFQSDLSGVKLGKGYAAKMMRLKHGRYWPDLFIAEPRGGHAGLFIEIKKSIEEVYTQTGDERESKRVIGQSAMLAELRKRGYRAVFGCGFEECKQVIDEYLGLEY